MNFLLRFVFLNPKKAAIMFILIALVCATSLWTLPLALGFGYMAYKHSRQQPLQRDAQLLKMTDQQLVKRVQFSMGSPPKNKEKLHQFERLYKKKLGLLFLQQRIQKAVFK